MNHPHDRAERLRLKRAKFEEEKNKTSHIKRRLKDNLRDQESLDEIKDYSHSGIPGAFS